MDNIESHNQQGGITAHTINVNNDRKNQENFFLKNKIQIIIGLITVVAACVTIANGGWGLFDRLTKKEKSMFK